MNYIDLFSGFGGFALGAYWAGMKFDKHYFSEVNKYCVELYQKRFPDAIALGDITKIKSMPGGDYFITGGFPCQPFSVAGKQKGEKDERNLWPGMFRVIRLCKPSWVVAENVPGAAPYIKKVVKPDLENEGYEVWPFGISAATIGAPHPRKRIWLVANSKTNRRERTICGDIEDSKDPGWPELQSSGSLDTRLFIFEEFEKRMGEPAVFPVDDGLPGRVAQLGGYGNSIVPQIAELFFRQIKELLND